MSLIEFLYNFDKHFKHTKLLFLRYTPHFVIPQGSLKISITKIVAVMILIKGQGVLNRMTKMMVL